MQVVLPMSRLKKKREGANVSLPKYALQVQNECVSSLLYHSNMYIEAATAPVRPGHRCGVADTKIQRVRRWEKKNTIGEARKKSLS